jgi:hypothetical protein
MFLLNTTLGAQSELTAVPWSNDLDEPPLQPPKVNAENVIVLCLYRRMQVERHASGLCCSL